MQTARLNQDDFGRLADAADEAKKLKLHVDDDGGLTIADIRVKARVVKGLKVLVLDYLQLSTSTLKNATTNDQVAEISKGLKRVALELGIAVVVLSQLNREVERRADREPILSDFRDSGAIEQDLDTAVLLWTVREDTEHDPTRLVGWKVAKNRGMAKGSFGMRFEPRLYAWRETSESITPQKTQVARGGFE
jgi:replicative DNA helicase